MPARPGNRQPRGCPGESACPCPTRGMHGGRWTWHCPTIVRGVKDSGTRGWFSAKQGPHSCQWETGVVKLTVSVCSLLCPVPSSARGSHGLQRGRNLGAKSRFSVTAAHPDPFQPCLAPRHPSHAPPAPQPHPPSPGAWLGCWAHAGVLVTSVSVLLTLLQTHQHPWEQHCSQGSALSSPTCSFWHQRGPHQSREPHRLHPNPAGSFPIPPPTHSLPSPSFPVPPGTFALAPAPGLSDRRLWALGAHREAGNRQQLPWWQRPCPL